MQFSNLPRPFFILAPMDDVTDTVFRQIVADCAKPDIFFTEFVNVDGLQSPGRHKLIRKLLMTSTDQPLIAQLWGKNPDNFRKTAEQIAEGTFAEELGFSPGINFSGIDLNMGCPQKNEVNAGTCSALINDRPLAEEIIKATQTGLNGRLPLSVKTRLGWNEIDLSWPEFLLKQNLSMLTIHGRTRKEMSKVPAHWEEIGKVREIRDILAVDTLIVGNGDVLSRNQGQELAEQYDLDGIMIGRGVFHDPYIFSPESPWPGLNKQQKIGLYTKHVQLFIKTWQNNERPIYTLNKFCKIYINGFDGAKEMREELMSSKSAEQLLSSLRPYSGIIL
ncbi:MAG TPA: tRNA-dihydrouridine synthase [Candidatus Saccharimonadales bacterium]|nr:tRNA-dihydrouridine synthase [Candidatus Saccharimonadales bacterium]